MLPIVAASFQFFMWLGLPMLPLLLILWIITKQNPMEVTKPVVILPPQQDKTYKDTDVLYLF